MTDPDPDCGPPVRPDRGSQLQLGPQASMETIPGSEPSSARPLKKRHLFNHGQPPQVKTSSTPSPLLQPTVSIVPTMNGIDMNRTPFFPPVAKTQATVHIKSAGCPDAPRQDLRPDPNKQVDLAEAVQRVLSSKSGSTPRIKLSKPRLPVKNVQQTLSIDRSRGPARVKLTKPRSPSMPRSPTKSPTKSPRKSEIKRKPNPPSIQKSPHSDDDAVPSVEWSETEYLHVGTTEEGHADEPGTASPPQDEPRSKLSDVDIDVDMLTYYPPQAEEGPGEEYVEEPMANYVDDLMDDVEERETRRRRSTRRAMESDEEEEDPAFKPSRKLKKAVRVMKPQFETRRRRSGRHK